VILILILIRPLSRAPAVFIIARARPSSPSPRVDARRSNRFASRSTRCDDARQHHHHHHHHHHHVESS
jgi:hypothetical protein